MITIEVIGMNHYMLSDYSHMHTKQIANLYETNEAEIFFHSGDLRLFHDGVDQTSWHTLIRVYAPKKYEPFEQNVAKYLLNSMTDYILNAHLEFVYIDEKHTYEKINHDYAPFFPREENNEEEYVEEEYDEDEDFSDEELFEGNAFEGFEEKLSARQAKDEEEKMCECGHQHVCCKGKSPACGKICACGERCSGHCHHDHECYGDDDCDCGCSHHHKH